MTAIVDIKTREILDSRGNPTVEADVLLEDGSFGRASVPSGASTGRHEALEKRDKDSSRFHGKGILGALKNIDDIIAPSLLGMNALNQRAIDRRILEIEGTPNKNHLGANATLAVSLSVAHAAAYSQEMPLYAYLGGSMANLLPIPMMNIINGGAHAHNGLDIQEIMIVPVGASDIQKAIRWGAEVYYTLKDILKNKGFSTDIGDEGGFAPMLRSIREALDILSEAVTKAGLSLGKDICFALDVAATELYKNGLYNLGKENLKLDSADLCSYYATLIDEYPLVSIEDGMAEDDWDGWQHLNTLLGEKIQIVGDDLFVTNYHRLSKGIEMNAANAILIKPNQVGTLTETWDTVQLANDTGMASIISHRSGETEDTTIADLAVALGCGQIKTGAPCRTDRTAKYNRLMRISEELEKGGYLNPFKIAADLTL